MNDDRGVSTVVGFVLILGITSLLVIGLLVGIGGFIDNQRQATVRDEMEVLGQQVAADIAASDRLVRAGGETVRVERELPGEVTGLAYTVTVTSSPDASSYVTTIELETSNPDISVDVSVRTATEVTGGSLNGGDLSVEYDSGPDELVVENV